MNSVEKIKALLLELTQLPGVSGMEQAVVRAVRNALRPLSDEVMVDAHGNVIAKRFGPDDAPGWMIAAHSDEVGGVVTAILPSGFLRFQTIGVVNPAVLPATRVRVENQCIGTVGSVVGHLTSGSRSGAVMRPHDLHIDIGVETESQVRAMGIREGSPIVFESPLHVLEGTTRVMGKAIDNRVGCAILIDLFEQIQGQSLPVTVYGVINVLEEIGMRGARMTSSRLKPDFAIVLDTVPADDTPLSARPEVDFSVGHGLVIQLCEGKAEQFLGTVAHPSVRDLILRTAKEEGIEVQLSAAYGLWTTDGATIHTTGEGIPTGFISIPRRYAHTPNELLDLRDAASATTLLRALVTRTAKGYYPRFLNNDE